MVWGIIGAMQAEISALTKQMENMRVQQVSGLFYYSGKLRGKDVVISCSEIGKVNAAMCAQTLVLRFGVGCIINTGVAGCVCDELGVLDLVISKELVFHDFDWGIMEDYHPHTSVFTADEELTALALSALAESEGEKPSHKLGRIATGDIFVDDEALRASIIERTAPDCVEMEGAAIALVAYSNKIPFLVIRSMSDNANGDAGMTYDEFVKIAADRSAHLLIKMLELAE